MSSTTAEANKLTHRQTGTQDRKPSAVQPQEQQRPIDDARDDQKDSSRHSYGKTIDGVVFKVPETHDMLSSLFDPRLPKSDLDLFTLATLLLQLVPLFLFPRRALRPVYLLSFLFWRLAYNAGLGWVLKCQSERRFLVRLAGAHRLFDRTRRPRLAAWLERQLEAKMSRSSDYSLKEVPLDYNVWLLFRQLVDVVLLNDFLAYLCLALCSLSMPAQPALPRQLLRWAAGAALVGFNVWVKLDAHRIVHDFAWYWGDAFFLSLRELVFDGVFEMAPHPMYSIGYAGFYGASLITGSRLVFFVSLVAHLCQFGFLVYFENPHIERVYGPQARPLTALQARVRPKPPATVASSEDFTAAAPAPARTQTRQELEHRFFRKDMLVLSNADRFRAADFAALLAILYSLLLLLIPHPFLACLNALLWRGWFSFGLGYRLRAQSESKAMVRHFLSRYYYGVGEEEKNEVIEECFGNWKGIYNLSLIMTYVSFGIMAIKFYKIDEDWDLSSELVRHTFGLCLIGIHLWTAKSTYEVLGKFGWFYGDFFIDDFPNELMYGGIYRFLNNPERSMGGAGYIGMSVMSGDRFVFGMAIGSVLCHWWFLSTVESPHMKKVYGDRIRKEAGLTKVLKQGAQRLRSRTRQLEGRAERDSRSVGRPGTAGADERDGRGFEERLKEVQGTFEFIYDETVQALDEFLEKSAPRLSGVVRDTKVLLQRSGERLILTRVANDLSSYDTSQYRLMIEDSPYHPARNSETGRLRFHMGEPIRLSWGAPSNHSRADWVGCYRCGSNRSGLVSDVASSGRWCGLFEEEWEGDIFIGKAKETAPSSPVVEADGARARDQTGAGGIVEFKGERLPWQEGVYEFRLHHDGKHNVMAVTEPFEIYVEGMGSEVEDVQEIEDKLRRLIGYGLGMEKRLIPRKLIEELEQETSGLTGKREGGDEEEGSDRFTVMSIEEAKRIQALVEVGTGIELGVEILIEDGDVGRLAQRLIFVKGLLKPFVKTETPKLVGSLSEALEVTASENERPDGDFN